MSGLEKIGGKEPADRLMQQVAYRSRNMISAGAIEPPTPLQVAAVLHALADHTAIMTALNHRPNPTSPWPEATSIGRWFHDVADSLEYGYEGERS